MGGGGPGIMAMAGAAGEAGLIHATPTPATAPSKRPSPSPMEDVDSK